MAPGHHSVEQGEDWPGACRREMRVATAIYLEADRVA
jgi:hypothetical protein